MLIRHGEEPLGDVAIQAFFGDYLKSWITTPSTRARDDEPGESL